MYNSRYNNSDYIAREFRRILEKKNAKSLEKTAQLRPEDFLINDSQDDVAVSSAIDNRINELTLGFTDEDFICETCNKTYDICKCEDPNDASDYLVNHAGNFMLDGLGKIAASLRNRGEGFAADVVEATSIKFQEKLVKEAAEKLSTVNELKKISSVLRNDGDNRSADLVDVTIENIKTGK